MTKSVKQKNKQLSPRAAKAKQKKSKPIPPNTRKSVLHKMMAGTLRPGRVTEAERKELELLKKKSRRGRRPAHVSPKRKKAPEVKVTKDFVRIATDYARRAVADKTGERFCKWVRLAASRYLRDLDRARSKQGPFGFDEGWANRACSFIERLPHVEGRWETPLITLHPAHVFFVVNVFGFRNLDGSRRFTSALLAIARKNAKSTLAAAILITCVCLEDEEGPQAVTAATTGSQARIVFNIAKRMVDKSPAIRREYDLEAFANSIIRWEVGGTVKPINAKASTQDGLNPSTVVLDEIHAHKSHDLLNVLKSAAGARLNPLWVYTTTEGYETPGPWPELRKFAQQLLEGLFEADHFFAIIFSLDEEVGTKGEPGYREADEDFDPSRWPKANPLIDVNPVLLREIEKEAIDAKQMPGLHAEFRIKRANRQSSTPRGWVRFAEWRACGGKVDLEWLKPYRCWGALDLSSTTDFCSFRLLWHVDERYFTWGRRWVPEATVKARAAKGTVPYAAWVNAGLLEVIPGRIIRHEVVAEAVLEAKAKFNLEKVRYDEWNAAQIVDDLTKEGVKMEKFIQGPKSYHPAMSAFEKAYLSGNLSHGGDPVLTWCAANLVVRYDVNRNMAPDKQRSSEKIDDMVALLMCFGEASSTPAGKDVQLFFV